MLPRHVRALSAAALSGFLLALGAGPAVAQDTPLVTGVHHVHMNVVDPDLSIAFYTGAARPTAQRQASRRLLLLTHNAFYKHDSLAAAETAVAELGREGGFEVTSPEGYLQEADAIDLSFISADYLAQFDGVMMMTNGELPLSGEQRRALVEFVSGGGGFVAVHQTVVTLYTFPWFGELVGAYLARGPIFDVTNREQRVAVLNVEDRDHPATRMLGESWALHDEFYQFASEACGTPRGRKRRSDRPGTPCRTPSRATA